MSEFLIKLFIKNKDDCKNPVVRQKYSQLASITGIIVNVLLFIGKLTVGILAASVAIQADAFNNISDAGSAVIALIGVHLSAKPVDKDHPWGHGRLEYVTGFIVDMLIILVGFELMTGSIDKIFDKQLPRVGNVTLVILAFSVLVKLWLFFFYRKIARRIDSTAIKGAASDSISDVFATTLVLASAIISRKTGVAVDGYAGVIVAAFILFTGCKAAKETMDLLLGTPPDPEFIGELQAFVGNDPDVVGIHDLMVHDYGPGRKFVSFHAEVPADCDFTAAHDTVDKIERDMLKKFGCIVTVHLDPIEVNNDKVDKMRELAVRCAKAVHPDFSIHDFRMTDGGKHVNLIFDLVVPTDCKIAREDAAKLVASKISEQQPDCFAVISAEHPFV